MIDLTPHIKWRLYKIGKKIFPWFGVYPLGVHICEDKTRLHLHESVQPYDTLFNVSSGHIYVDEGTIFAHNVMVITGKHERSWNDGKWVDCVPKEGRDIHIGKRCWICSGAIILGGVTIGDESIIAAGAIVTKDVLPKSMIKGVH